MERMSLSALLLCATPDASRKSKRSWPFSKAVFEMEFAAGAGNSWPFGEREVVGSNEAQCTASEQALNKRLRAGPAIIGIGAAEQFVEQEQDRRGLFAEFGNQFQAQNFGVKREMPPCKESEYRQMRLPEAARDEADERRPARRNVQGRR